jgi:hypothetical protein
VLTRVATALPGDSSGGTADATAWAGDGSCGSRSASQLAAALPAVSLADALGRAVNSRLKYLAFKAGLHDAALTRRKLLAQICDATGGAQGGDGSGRGSGSSQSASSDSSGSGEALASAVLEFSSGAAGEAARYTEGQARLAALRALRGLPAALRRSAARARVSACGRAPLSRATPLHGRLPPSRPHQRHSSPHPHPLVNAHNNRTTCAGHMRCASRWAPRCWRC